MQMLHTEYYKKFGIRRLSTMTSPFLFKLDSLPRNAIYHYLGAQPDVVDVDTSQMFFANYRTRIETFLVSEISDPVGRPIRAKTLPLVLSQPFFKEHRNFKLLKNLDMIPRDPGTLLVMSYGYLQTLYKYPETPMSDWNQWFNIQKTMWENVKTMAQLNDRQQFIFVSLPNQLLGRNILNMFEDKQDATMAKVFDTPEERFLLDFWRWLKQTKDQQSSMSVLDEKDLTKINLIFSSENGLNCLINLAYLNSWIKGQSNQTDTRTLMQVDREQICKMFVNLMIFLKSQRPEEQYTELEKLEMAEKTDTQEETDGADPLDPSLSEAQQDSDSEDLSKTYTPPISSIKAGTDTKPTASEDLEDELVDNSTELTTQLNKIDEELKILDKLSLKALSNKGIKFDQDAHSVSDIASQEQPELDPAEVAREFYSDPSDIDTLVNQVNDLAESGVLTAREYKTVLGEIQKTQEALDPYGSGKKAAELAKVTTEDLVLDQNKTTMVGGKTVVDKSMLNSTLLSYDSDYLNKVIKKDTLAMIAGLQRAGVIIKKHEMESDDSVMGRAENHTLELKPIDGISSRIHFRIPKVDEDGTFMANGSIYTMRKQRVDLPILKIDPITVALSSYYGKNFVAINERVSASSTAWLSKQITKAGMEDHPVIKQVDPANVFDESFEAPYIYNTLATKFKGIRTAGISLNFDHTEREKLFGVDLIKKLEVKGSRLVGVTKDKSPVIVNTDNEFIAVKQDSQILLGSIYDVLELNEASAPVDYTEMRVFSKVVPVGVILGYLIGLKKLMKLLKVEPQVIDGKRATIKTNEYALKFHDKIYVFSKKDRLASLVLSGFLQFEKQIRLFNAVEFDNKDVYFNLLDSKGMGSIYLREIDLADQMFVDPITRGILAQMNEPTTFRGLLLRSSEMLLNYHKVPNVLGDDLRTRGYERIPGAIYKELTRSIRQFRNGNISGRSKINISPYQIWSAVMKDPAIKITENINPVQNVKETESATFVGEGGRSKDSMNKASRAYRREDMGVVSEATVDSSDVGINIYLSADPVFKDMRGLPDKKRPLKASNLFSTAALLAPGASNDDGKRTNFISIQQSHTVMTKGSHVPLIRTGAESIISNRTSPMFAYNAKQDGKVISVEDLGMVIEYADGSRVGLPLGRTFGKAEGSIYPHDLRTTLTPGKKFRKGENITFNEGFFEPDRLNPGQIVMKNSRYITVALFESNATFEDSSSISARLGQEMITRTTKMKSITLSFKQSVHNVVKLGSTVNAKEVLLLIEDEITSGSTAFDDESLSVLKNLSRQAPRSKYKGTVDRIEVFYHGDKADMSPTLRALADRSDKELAAICRHTGKPVVTGRVNDDYRVSGTPLTLDKAEIRFYISVETQMGGGDKGIFGNQLKSVVGEVMDYSVTTESGTVVDAFYNFRGVSARIVESAMLIGTTAGLLRTGSKNAVKIYKGVKL